MNIERLNSYFPFDSAVLDAVGQAAEFQNTLSYHQIAAHYNVPQTPQLNSIIL